MSKDGPLSRAEFEEEIRQLLIHFAGLYGRIYDLRAEIHARSEPLERRIGQAERRLDALDTRLARVERLLRIRPPRRVRIRTLH